MAMKTAAKKNDFSDANIGVEGLIREKPAQLPLQEPAKGTGKAAEYSRTAGNYQKGNEMEGTLDGIIAQIIAQHKGVELSSENYTQFARAHAKEVATLRKSARIDGEKANAPYVLAPGQEVVLAQKHVEKAVGKYTDTRKTEKSADGEQNSAPQIKAAPKSTQPEIIEVPHHAQLELPQIVMIKFTAGLRQLASLTDSYEVDAFHPPGPAAEQLKGDRGNRKKQTEATREGITSLFGVNCTADSFYFENFGKIMPTETNHTASDIVQKSGKGEVLGQESLDRLAKDTVTELWGIQPEKMGTGERLLAESYVKLMLLRQVSGELSENPEEHAEFGRRKNEALGGMLGVVRSQILGTPSSRQAWNGFVHLANESLFQGLRQNGIDGQIDISESGKLGFVFGVAPSMALPGTELATTLNNGYGAFLELVQKIGADGGSTEFEAVARGGVLLVAQDASLTSSGYSVDGRSFRNRSNIPKGAIPLADAYATMKGHLMPGGDIGVKYSVRADLPPIVLDALINATAGRDVTAAADRFSNPRKGWQDYAFTITPQIEAERRLGIGIPAVVRAGISGNVFGARLNDAHIGIGMQPFGNLDLSATAGAKSPTGMLAPYLNARMQYSFGDLQAYAQANVQWLRGGGNFFNYSVGISYSGIADIGGIFGGKKTAPTPEAPIPQPMRAPAEIVKAVPVAPAEIKRNKFKPMFTLDISGANTPRIDAAQVSKNTLIFFDTGYDLCRPTNEENFQVEEAAKNATTTITPSGATVVTANMKYGHTDAALLDAIGRIREGERIDHVVIAGYGKVNRGISGESPAFSTIMDLMALKEDGFAIPKVHFIGISEYQVNGGVVDMFRLVGQLTGGSVQLRPDSQSSPDVLAKTITDVVNGKVNFPLQPRVANPKEEERLESIGNMIRVAEFDYKQSHPEHRLLSQLEVEVMATQIELTGVSLTAVGKNGREEAFYTHLYGELAKALPGFQNIQIGYPKITAVAATWKDREFGNADFATREFFRALDSQDYALTFKSISEGVEYGRENGGEFPLSAAVNSKFGLKQKEELISLMIEKGAKVETKYNQSAPMVAAVRINSPELLKMLLEHHKHERPDRGAETTTLWYAARSSGNPEIFKMLVDGGADIKYSSNTSALIEAILSNNPRAIKPLLDLGADPLAPLECGARPINIAISRENKEVAKEMFAHADLLNPEWTGRLTAVAGNSSKYNPAIYEALRETFAKRFWITDAQEFSPITEACREANPGFDTLPKFEKLRIASEVISPITGKLFRYERHVLDFAAPKELMGSRAGDCDEFSCLLVNYATTVLGYSEQEFGIATFNPKGSETGHGFVHMTNGKDRFIFDLVAPDFTDPSKPQVAINAGGILDTEKLDMVLARHAEYVFANTSQNIIGTDPKKITDVGAPAHHGAESYALYMGLAGLDYAAKKNTSERKAAEDAAHKSKAGNPRKRKKK